MLMAFIESLKTESMSKYSQETITVLISCDPYLINYFMHLLLSKTNAYDVPAVIGNITTSLTFLFIETLSVMDTWFMGVKGEGLPDTFDIDFFCKAISIIISTDHHQLITKVLTLIFMYLT